MRPSYQRVNPIKDQDFYDQYVLDRPWCEFCGVPAAAAPHQPDAGGVGLTRHHIIKFKRSDERTNVIVACCRDHALCEGLLVRNPQTGLLYPKLTLGIVLTVKRLRDPDGFDAKRLQELYGQTLPDFEPIPKFLIDEWTNWTCGGGVVLVQ